jgi:hypothetical protein
MPTRVLLWLALIGVVPSLSGCDLTPPSDILDGKACDARGRCTRGYRCDVRYNVCRKNSAMQGDAEAQ